MTYFVVANVAVAVEFKVHYHRPEADYEGWALWSWNPDTQKSQEVLAEADTDEFGAVYRIETDPYGDLGKIGFLPKLRNWEQKDGPDRFWTQDLGQAVYIVAADKNLYQSPPPLVLRVIQAHVDAPDRMRIVLSKSVPEDSLKADRVVVWDGHGGEFRAKSVSAAGWIQKRVNMLDAVLDGNFPIECLSEGRVMYGDYRPGPLIPGKILDDPSFYSDVELGAIWSDARTVFRTFAPTALEVSVRLYEAPTGGAPKEFAMERIGHGIWEASVEGDMRNVYYKFHTRLSDGEFEVVDPYSRSNTAHNGRCMVVADATPVAPPPAFAPEDAIIYELHIRDFTIDPAAGVSTQHRGKYLGLTEEGTRFSEDRTIRTALDHLKELGVNVVQILPFQDFDNNESSEAYNWGYMPYHFNSPDGWFATRRDDATRVREVKRMVGALHRAGIKVVMDVVYNHTAEGSPQVRMSFNGLAPNYYYRTRPDGSYWNGSGTGNEFRSEAPMVRKYIVDSLTYWVREYDIDGFRFDLMGLIDLETCKQVVAEVRKIKPDALIYGEPWAAGETPIDKTEKGDQRGLGFGVFNDHFRDGIRGSTFNKNPGFAQGWPENQRIKKGVKGSITDFTKAPIETINYCEAHDNHTFWDRLQFTTEPAYGVTHEEKKKMQKLAGALILTSQGVPFLHAGQELLRTKDGEDNSYNKPDAVNQIHWRWKKENWDVFAYYRDLIHLRRRHPMFRMKTAAEIKDHLFLLDDDLGYPVPSAAVGYVLNRGTSGDNWTAAVVLFNAKPTPTEFQVPEAFWTPVALGEPDSPVFSKPTGEAGVIRVPGRSAAIYYSTDETVFETKIKPRLVFRKSKVQKFSVKAPKAGRVAVAGSFNGWRKDELFMEKHPDGTWTAELELEFGAYEFKYVADDNWETLNKDNLKIEVR
ncbi:MAG: type I pullulanase [Candidatus Lindowbacteria bacterium RIFCSPLOWO2_12_FULL_62_27]|nr:MAG: type I pullulanase [Candidatus Lindowbacteria bacterium RIFCSPLOWO2_12_FULL_62_27]